MTDEQFLNLTEQILTLRREIVRLQASVKTLKIYAVSQLSPADFEAGLKQIQLVEEAILGADSNDQELKKALDIIEASRHWKNLENPPEKS